MKSSQWVVYIIITTLVMPIVANADSTIPPPDLNAYIAKQPPTAKTWRRLLNQIYISPRFGMSLTSAKSISSATNEITSEAFSRSFNNRPQFNLGLAVGFEFPAIKRVLTNSLEVEYMHRSEFTYTMNPVFKANNFSSTSNTSKVGSQTWMLNWYLGFRTNSEERGWGFFLVGGFGQALQITKSSAKFNDSDVNTTSVSSSRKKSKRDFAWNIGLGASYRFNEHLQLQGDYQYVRLGNIKWAMFTNAGYEAFLQTKSVFAQSLMIGLNYYL